MTPTKGQLKALTGVTLAAIIAAALATGFPAAARGPADGPGMEGGPFGMMDFDTLDTDKDGKITAAEISARRQAAVADSDADKDGKLSVEELTAQEMRLMTDRAKSHAERMVADHDSDGDGLLSVAELAAPPVPATLFDRIDADGDGAITRDEADAARAKFAERMEERGHGGWKKFRGPQEN